MKMRWYDRILVSLSGVVLAVAGVLTALSAVGVVKLPTSLGVEDWLASGWQWTPLLAAVGVLIVAWGVHLLIRPMMGIRESRKGKYYTVKTGDGDGVHISMQALDHLVHKCLERWPEVLNANVKIGGQEEAMSITLRVSLVSDVRIPELLQEVRVQIRQYIEECSGVAVNNVKVVVETTKEKEGAVSKGREVKLLKATKPEEPEPPAPPVEAEPQKSTEPEPSEDFEDIDLADAEEDLVEEDSDDAWL